MRLAEYRSKSARLADFLPWAALIAPGVILNKDGSLQRTARFRGPDLDSATPAELVATSARLNSALRRLGSGWTVFVEAQRIPALDYPASEFPDPVSALVDAERRAQFEEAGAHFESAYFLTLVWMPPADDASRAEGWLLENAPDHRTKPQDLVSSFVGRADRLIDLLDGFMPEIAWLSDAETLTYLHTTVSTRRQRVRIPEVPMHLDAVLADDPLVGGLTPRLGTAHLKTLAIKMDDACAGITPAVETARDKSYPIARPLFMYTRGQPEGATKAYLDWILSDAGQCIIQKKGYAPVKAIICN